MPDDSYRSDDEQDSPYNAPYLDRVFRFRLGDVSYNNVNNLNYIKRYLEDEMRKQSVNIVYTELHRFHDIRKVQLLLDALREIYEKLITIQIRPEFNSLPEIHDPYLRNIYISIFVTVHTTSSPPNQQTIWKIDNNGNLYAEQEAYVDDYDDVLCGHAHSAIENIQQLKTYLLTIH